MNENEQPEMDKAYDPQSTERRLYDWWEAKGFFRPEKTIETGLAEAGGPRWCITMPPPNVTGALHLGHALTAAVEDLMTRYYRMRGFETLFLPGSDHAGIATQNVVERELAKQGISRYDLGRQKFIERVWEWKDVYHARITEQHKRLGISCDWERERFTLDEGLSHAVRTAFVRLFEKGLIYRGAYLVNWCPRCESAISDLEAIAHEHDDSLWYIRYPIVNADWGGPAHPWGSGRWAEGATDFIEMATARPETIMGDTAVATREDHPRFGHLIGRTAVLPIMERLIPIISDEFVDPKFGTGAVKITPAHDPDDYEVGLRHGLDAPTILTDTGKMNELAGPYEGLDRYDARDAVVRDFERERLLIKTEPYHHSVAHCERCHTVVEPRISTQWFLNVKPLADAAIEAVRRGETTIIPEREERRFYHWMENIRPWCISRQLWWGHRIPVWYCDECGEVITGMEDPQRCPKCKRGELGQDPDVLDTWFSSGLWPFSTLGWPDETPDMRRFYPTDMRETGYDILFFWVAREMMLGIEMTGQAPYPMVYLHGLVRNEHGKKVSKSMENIEEYDPLNIVERFGADALRYTLLTSSTPGNDMNLDPRRLEGARNFANKMWNAARFVISNIQSPTVGKEIGDLDASLPDRWIVSRLHRLIGEVTELFESYQYGEAGRRINDFLWSELCDWYIEATKIRLYSDDKRARTAAQRVLVYVLDHGLRLLHPYMPFVTEEIWQHLKAASPEGESWPESIMISPWPEMEGARLDVQAEGDMALLMDLIRQIRNARAEFDVMPGRRIAAIVVADGKLPMFEAQRALLSFLAKVDEEQLTLTRTLEEKPKKAVALVGAEGVEAYLPLAGLVDLDQEIERLRKELGETEQEIRRAQGMLANEGFTGKAPEHVVQRQRDRLAEQEERRERLEARLRALTG
ncbi:MAG TPA: valine--tRNA ligase [Anaerolineae bacterium]|nr:valine--tRNA ligase [Anaerolineae bacterium]